MDFLKAYFGVRGLLQKVLARTISKTGRRYTSRRLDENNDGITDDPSKIFTAHFGNGAEVW
jgi:hypothetical protein